MKIAIVRERADGETRVAATPETVQKLTALGGSVVIEAGAGALARFPDAVTERGQKHLLELMRLKKEGNGAELVFVVQRESCTAFAPADHIDPEYGRLLREARKNGVIIRAYACKIDPTMGVTLDTRPLHLDF